MRKKNVRQSIGFLLLQLIFMGCGVKAPPLPPLPVIPQTSEMQRPRSTPSASLVPDKEESVK